MELTRTRVEGPQPAVSDLRVRQLKAQQMLRDELAGKDLEDFVEERLVFTTLAWATRRSGQNTIEAAAFLRSQPTAPQPAAVALATSTAMPTAM